MQSTVTNLTISSLPVVINCAPFTNMQFHSITHVAIHSILFNGCLENELDTIDKFIIKVNTIWTIGMQPL